jgi:hypothetical protein
MRVTARVKVNISACRRTIYRQAHPQISDALVDLAGIFSEEFGGVKTGRIYRRARGPHQASAPGEPPARDTRELERSISRPQFLSPNVGQLRIRAPHGRLLERGTPRMAARPFIRPAVKLMLIRRRKGGR